MQAGRLGLVARTAGLGHLGPPLGVQAPRTQAAQGPHVHGCTLPHFLQLCGVFSHSSPGTDTA